MEQDTPQYWFPVKRYGWGWGLPATWQGWFVFLTWIAILLSASIYLAPRNLALFFTFVAAMIAAIIAICYAKGEPPHWRWGNNHPPADKV